MQNKNLKIKVLGIGSGVQKSIDYLYLNNKYENINFMLIDSHEKVLKQAKTQNKYLLVKNNYNGEALGCCGNLNEGEKLAFENLDKFWEITKDADFVFLISTFGGGTGTGVTPVIARILKNANIQTIAIITTPFTFEGRKRTEQAQNGLEKLKQNVEKFILINNDELIGKFPPSTSISTAFEYVNEKIAEEFYKNLFDIISD